MNITRNQWLAIAILFFTVLSGGSAQLVDLFGQHNAKLVIAFSTLVTGFLAGAQIILGGQNQQIQDVRNMAENPGSVTAPAAQRALVEATSAVVNSSAAGPVVTKEAKVALLDATANLEEVKGDIRVTGGLADATASTQIKPA